MSYELWYTLNKVVEEMGSSEYFLRGVTPDPHTNCFLCPQTGRPVQQYEIAKRRKIMGFQAPVAQASVYSQPVRGGQVYTKIYEPSMRESVEKHLQPFAEESGLELSINSEF